MSRFRTPGPVVVFAAFAAGGACVSEEPLQQPTPLFESAPVDFPLALWDQGAEGETILMVHITPMGTVDSVYVHESSGYAQFDSAAVAGAQMLRFTPGRRGDRRVDMWARLPVRFDRGLQSGAFGVPTPPDSASPGGGEPEPDPEGEADAASARGGAGGVAL
ncbi:MAG TPA: energy transducer TonB [Longimicrobiales bacterium]|nr:energy transducer TonB [Longimicrobiales bacterium]